ncbi:hypothetical protein B14911_07875 [Bacillus sp. NRRL B-14911]|nr:hypothetical protein B14911_07875 [Bacillus sp. NRRL B-14911]
MSGLFFSSSVYSSSYPLLCYDEEKGSEGKEMTWQIKISFGKK